MSFFLIIFFSPCSNITSHLCLFSAVKISCRAMSQRFHARASASCDLTSDLLAATISNATHVADMSRSNVQCSTVIIRSQKKCNFTTPLIKKLYIKKWGHKNLLLHRYKKHYDKVTKTYYSTDTKNTMKRSQKHTTPQIQKHYKKVTKTYYSTDTKR